MSFDNFIDLVRSVNLTLGIVTLFWLVIRRIRKPHWYSGGGLRNDIWFMSVYWILALVVGSFEQIFNTDTEIRVAFATVALLITIRILLRPVHEWNDNRDTLV